MEYKKPKGTFDILPKASKPEDKWRESGHYQYLEKVLRDASHDYGFQEMRTPIFESTDLFVRSSGETSDIVSKEMYSFQDKGDRSLTLRPEGTAPVIRAFIENNLQTQGSLHKFFYVGPYFRYDRPQAGRFRQFHQYGVEAIGSASPEVDVEMIDLLMEIYKRLGLKNLQLMINSVGDAACRSSYSAALRHFLQPHLSDLSEESQNRFAQNPLRILDTKNSFELELLKSAPSMLDHLNEECRIHFERICSLLDKLKIPYVINDKLVRGLDYYTKTVFEVTSDILGAQNTIGAGGRFDALMKSLGGPDLPAIGFGTGIERILHTMEGQKCPALSPYSLFAFLIPLGEKAKEALFELALRLRHQRIATEICLKTEKIAKALSQAESLGARFALILGEQELERGVIQIKDLVQRESVEKPLDEIVTYMSELRKNYV